MKIAALILLLVVNVWSEERIRIEGQINHSSARLFFDTGARYIYLFRPAAERLGLSLPAANKGSDWDTYWATRKYDVNFPGLIRRARIAILEMPDYLASNEYDGILGWGEVSRRII